MLNCLAGIDEAGLGPILGPLVIGGVAMRGPSGVDPWDALQPTVARTRPKPNQLHVADSKKVKSGPRGFERLERTVLTFWSAWRGELPPNVHALLTAIGADPDALARSCPWYADLHATLPRVADRASLELGGHLLRQRMDDTGIEILEIALRSVDVPEFNRLIQQTDNKATAHFQSYAKVLCRLLACTPDGAHVVADRCGGRMRYRKPLLDAGAARHIRVLREDQGASIYDLSTKTDGSVRVTFTSQGEERAFPTALASCAAKYLRELMVDRINDWFGAAVPGLKRTAGYYVDGHRFLQDIRSFAEAEQLPMERLVRVR